MGVIATYGLTVLLAIPLGRFYGKVFRGEKNVLAIMAPLERLIYRLGGIDPNRDMHWKDNLIALLTINAVWLVYAFVLLLTQGGLPLNPDGNPSQTADLAFNTAISFVVNCNLQHYSGESGLTYLTQLGVITFLQFVSAATGIAALVLIFRHFLPGITDRSGNFYAYIVKSITRILLPLCLILAIILTFNGTPASFDGKDTIITMQGDTVGVSRGPAAGMIAIKHLGTNGGGWFGANSAHPLENPNYLTNMLEMMAQVLIPIAMIFALGYVINRRRFAQVVFGVMTFGMLCLLLPTLWNELSGNPALAHLGVSQPTGAMEGKEVRFGPLASGYWSIVTTIISTGSVNSLLIAGIAKLAPGGGAGEKVTINGKVVGYANIGQKFTEDRYFNSRPSAVDYNAAGSAGSNKGPSNPDYLKTVQARIDMFLVHNPGVRKADIPAELVTASGSGLDPDLSPAGARIQVSRIARIRNIGPERLNQLINDHTKEPLLGLFGPATVNVLKLNRALDELK